jgi:hypothetical protein
VLNFLHSSFLYTLFLLLLYWGHIVTFTKVLIIYHSWIYPLHHSPLSPLPIPGTVSTGLIFPFSYMLYTYVHHIHPPTPFPYILPPPTGTNPRQDLFFFSVIKKAFCLFKIAIQGVSLWHFHVYMYYNLNCSSPPLFFFLP